MTGRAGVLYWAHKIEISCISVFFEEGRTGLQEEGVAGQEHDIADLASEKRSMSGHGKHYGIVACPEAPLPDGAAYQRGAMGNYGLEQ